MTIADILMLIFKRSYSRDVADARRRVRQKAFYPQITQVTPIQDKDA
ncbi:MAG: hypothetical protein PF501_00070 [Salinisphaera sp.]|nr:hypothetical protein [Salinisphaera sp.]